MFLWFDEDGTRVGMCSDDILTFSIPTTKVEVDDVDESKVCRLINGEVVYSDPVEVPEDTAAMSAMQTRKNRRAAYPSIEEQLDYIYHNGVDAWKTDMIDPVKAQYPKS